MITLSRESPRVGAGAAADRRGGGVPSSSRAPASSDDSEEIDAAPPESASPRLPAIKPSVNIERFWCQRKERRPLGKGTGTEDLQPTPWRWGSSFEVPAEDF